MVRRRRRRKTRDAGDGVVRAVGGHGRCRPLAPNGQGDRRRNRRRRAAQLEFVYSAVKGES